MISFQGLPSVGAPRERLADWLEFLALTSRERETSRANLVAALGIAGGIRGPSAPDDEELDDTDTTLEGIADAVFAELDDRLLATGGEAGVFPFRLSENLLGLKSGMEESVYTFMVMLAHWPKENSGFFKEGVKLFEELSAEAAKKYLGGSKLPSESMVFGFPRRGLPAGFAAAVKELCCKLGEGNGPKRNRPKMKDQKDAKLDVVAWTSFLDGRSGKLIAFGQCATGYNWESKTAELGDPRDWWDTWIDDRPGAWPVKMFFVPHRVSARDWLHVCSHAGILFDRCRIAHLASDVSEPLRSTCGDWASQALMKVTAG
jgi:hypothetical protein